MEILKQVLSDNQLTERVQSKILQARYDMYLWAWVKGDEWLKTQNEKLKAENKPEMYGTVEEYYNYYLKYWCTGHA